MLIVCIDNTNTTECRQLRANEQTKKQTKQRMKMGKLASEWLKSERENEKIAHSENVKQIQ